MTKDAQIRSRAERAYAILTRAKKDKTDPRKAKRFVNYILRTHRLNKDRAKETSKTRRAIIQILFGLV